MLTRLMGAVAGILIFKHRQEGHRQEGHRQEGHRQEGPRKSASRQQGFAMAYIIAAMIALATVTTLTSMFMKSSVRTTQSIQQKAQGKQTLERLEAFILRNTQEPENNEVVPVYPLVRPYPFDSETPRYVGDKTVAELGCSYFDPAEYPNVVNAPDGAPYCILFFNTLQMQDEPPALPGLEPLESLGLTPPVGWVETVAMYAVQTSSTAKTGLNVTVPQVCVADKCTEVAGAIPNTIPHKTLRHEDIVFTKRSRQIELATGIEACGKGLAPENNPYKVLWLDKNDDGQLTPTCVLERDHTLMSNVGAGLPLLRTGQTRYVESLGAAIDNAKSVVRLSGDSFINLSSDPAGNITIGLDAEALVKETSNISLESLKGIGVPLFDKPVPTEYGFIYKFRRVLGKGSVTVNVEGGDLVISGAQAGDVAQSEGLNIGAQDGAAALYAGMNGNKLLFRRLASDGSITLTQDKDNRIVLGVDPTALLKAKNLGDGVAIAKGLDKEGNFEFRTLVAGRNVSITRLADNAGNDNVVVISANVSNAGALQEEDPVFSRAIRGVNCSSTQNLLLRAGRFVCVTPEIVQPVSAARAAATVTGVQRQIISPASASQNAGVAPGLVGVNAPAEAAFNAAIATLNSKCSNDERLIFDPVQRKFLCESLVISNNMKALVRMEVAAQLAGVDTTPPTDTTPPPVNTPPPAPVADGTGLLGAYYNGAHFNAKAFERVDAGIDFNFGKSSPDARITDADSFSIHWTGEFLAPVTGDVTFYVTSDDGTRLDINGKLLVNQWVQRAPTTDTVVVNVVAGQKYTIVMDYFDNYLGALAKLEWSYAGQDRQIIPATYLFPAAANDTGGSTGGSTGGGTTGGSTGGGTTGGSTGGSIGGGITPPPAPAPTPALSIGGVNNGDTVKGVFAVSANVLNVVPDMVSFRLFNAATNDQMIQEDSKNPYNASFDTTKMSNGTYELSVIARTGATSVAIDTRVLTVANAAVNPGGSTTGGNTTTGGDTGTNTGGTGTTTGSIDFAPLLAQYPDIARGTMPVSNPYLGINLASVSYHTQEWIFVDAMKTSKTGWYSARKKSGGSTWDDKSWPIKSDTLGWPVLEPGQAAATLMFREIGGRYPSGNYTILYEGEGDVTASLDAKEVISKQPGKLVVRVAAGNGGVLLTISNSNPKNRVRNVRFYMPGFAPGETYNPDGSVIFHPLFVERLKPFKVLRFMDWQRTNGSGLVKWSDRTTPAHRTQAGRNGVALEYMIALCNKLKCDPWFNIPHLADDTFIREHAKMVKAKLHSGAKSYVEYSNELWNYGFSQYKYLEKTAPTLGLSIEDLWARNTGNVFKIYESVYGAQSDKLVLTVGTQSHWLSRWGKVPKKLAADGIRFDALAITAYFATGDFSGSTSASDYKKKLDIALADMGRYEREAKALTNELAGMTGRKVRLVTYEAGTHMLNQPLNSYLTNMDAQAFMYDIMTENMARFHRNGGDLYTAFNYVMEPSKWGYWGHLRYQDQPLSKAHKFRAMLDYVRSPAYRDNVAALQ